MDRQLRSLLAAIMLLYAVSAPLSSNAAVDSCVGRDLGDVVKAAGNADAAAVDRDNLAMTKLLKHPPMTPAPWRFSSAAEVSAFYFPLVTTLKD